MTQPAGLPVALGIQTLDTGSDGWRRVALRRLSPALAIRVLDPAGNRALPGAVGALYLGTQATGTTVRFRADGSLDVLPPPDTADLANTEAALLAHPSVRQVVVDRGMRYAPASRWPTPWWMPPCSGVF
jgi:hypothetical protein